MAACVRTWVVVVALAFALVLLPRRPVVEAEEETVAAATAEASFGLGAAKPKCQPGVTTGPCRVSAVHDPENSEEEGLFSMKARAPSGAPDADSDDDYSDADHDDLIVLGH